MVEMAFGHFPPYGAVLNFVGRRAFPALLP